MSKDFNWQRFHEDLDFVLAEYLIDVPKGSINDEIIELAQFSNHKRLIQNKPQWVEGSEALSNNNGSGLAELTDAKLTPKEDLSNG